MSRVPRGANGPRCAAFGLAPPPLTKPRGTPTRQYRFRDCDPALACVEVKKRTPRRFSAVIETRSGLSPEARTAPPRGSVTGLVIRVGRSSGRRFCINGLATIDPSPLPF